MRAPLTIRTARLTIRRPAKADARAVFARYASDAEATRYMSWPTHRSVADARAFVVRALEEWSRNGVGPYLLELDGEVIGSTGLHLLAPYRAMTGYILARDQWGRGFATEACLAMVELGRTLGLARVEAQCHADHRASARVLEKSGMALQGVLRRYLVLPNLSNEPQDVRSYAWTR